MNSGNRIANASDNPDWKASLIKEYDSILTSDSYYKNRAVVRRMVAVLYAFDNQMLGKVLTIITLDYDSIDLTSEA
jgi:hypothetical protein